MIEIQAAVDGSISLEYATKPREVLCRTDEINARKQTLEAKTLHFVSL
jgi:hypothetical protein